MAYKVIKGYEKYVIFSDGRIWSRSKHLFMKPSLTIDGYPQTMFNRKSQRIHRLIAKAFVDNPNNYTEVNHIDGNKQNNNSTNLKWCSRSENVKHSYKLGLRRNNKNENNPNCKISNDDVISIRNLYSTKSITQKKIGLIYGIRQATVSSIILNKFRVL